MTVSVIMSVFNGEKFLEEAVESILMQTFEDFEFIIVDDGSTDRSGLMLDRFASQDDRIRVLHQRNQGLIRSLNLACSLAKGKYLARMDADDIAVVTRLRLQVDFLEAQPDISVLGSAVWFVDDEGNVLYLATRPLSESAIRRALPDANVFWHPSVMMRAATFHLAGGYRNVPDAEDYDLWLRMGECHGLANLFSPLLKYRIHGAQVSVNKTVQQAYGALACQASARLRREGKPDLLEANTGIDADLLTRMGVNAGDQQTAIGRGYLVCGRNLSRAGNFDLALTMLKSFDSGDLLQAQSWVIADAYLCTAKIYWTMKAYRRSLSYLVRALVTRPITMGRPLKSLWCRLQSSVPHFKPPTAPDLHHGRSR